MVLFKHSSIFILMLFIFLPGYIVDVSSDDSSEEDTTLPSAHQDCSLQVDHTSRGYKEYLLNIATLNDTWCTFTKGSDTETFDCSTEIRGAEDIPEFTTFNLTFAEVYAISYIELRRHISFIGINFSSISISINGNESIWKEVFLEQPNENPSFAHFIPPIYTSNILVRIPFAWVPLRVSSTLRYGDMHIFALKESVINVLKVDNLYSSNSFIYDFSSNFLQANECLNASRNDSGFRTANNDCINDSITVEFKLKPRLRGHTNFTFGRFHINTLNCTSLRIRFCGNVIDRVNDDQTCSFSEEVQFENVSANASLMKHFEFAMSHADQICFNIECGNGFMQVLATEIYATTEVIRTTTPPTPENLPTTEDTDIGVTTEPTVEDDDEDFIVTETLSTQVRIQLTTNDISNLPVTTQAPAVGLTIECSMKLNMAFVEEYANEESDAYLSLRIDIKEPIENGFFEVYSDLFIKTYDFTFRAGSVDTRYSADLGAGATFTNDQRDRLRDAIVDALDSSNITVDPNTIVLAPKPTDSTPAPTQVPTEELLLAGIMGAVVTLLVIALAIAAVAIRLCIVRIKKNRNEENQNDEYPTMDGRRRSSSRDNFPMRTDIPAFITNSLRRYNTPGSSFQQHDAFEFPTPLRSNGFSSRHSDLSDGSNEFSRNTRNQRMADYRPRHTSLNHTVIDDYASSRRSISGRNHTAQHSRRSSRLTENRSNHVHKSQGHYNHTITEDETDYSNTYPYDNGLHRSHRRTNNIPPSLNRHARRTSHNNNNNSEHRNMQSRRNEILPNGDVTIPNGITSYVTDSISHPNSQRIFDADLDTYQFNQESNSAMNQHRPRLRRQPSTDPDSDGARGSSGVTNDAFDDEALTPYYLANDERSEASSTAGGFLEKISRSLSLGKEQQVNLHRKKTSYSKARTRRRKDDSIGSRL